MAEHAISSFREKKKKMTQVHKKSGGEITRQAAYLGVAIYAEHIDDSHPNPGKHPNIDRLFNVINSGRTLVATVKAAQ